MARATFIYIQMREAWHEPIRGGGGGGGGLGGGGGGWGGIAWVGERMRRVHGMNARKTTMP